MGNLPIFFRVRPTMMGTLPILHEMLTITADLAAMTNYRRLRQPGGTYFFTVCLSDRSGRLLVDHINTLRWAYAKTMAEMPVTCPAMVVLPDHLHAIWTLPDGDHDFSERWRKIKARFSHALLADPNPNASKTAKRERGVWQRRFWEHRVRDDAELQTIIAYCRNNPVKHGHVTDPQDWPYSSFSKRA